MDLKKELNKEQYNAVTNDGGPSLVLAGAGSGKTRTLTYRVAHLVMGGVNPENILLVTFTNKAADEMLKRVEEILGYYPKNIWGGTFHHIANKLLRRYASLIGYENNFTILDREDSNMLVKQAYNEIVDADKKSRYFPKSSVISNLIGYARNRGKSLYDLMKEKYDYLDDQELNMAQLISNRYMEKKKEANLMDFDDLLINLLSLLIGNSGVSKKLSDQFRYILVDEYQDTNKIQSDIINILAKKHKNIMVVGDDSQSIYSFRAADISNILDFPKNFKDTKIYKLETNYRSSPQILNLANSSILNNKNKFVKNLNSIKKDSIKPNLIINQNNRKQAQFICNEIIKLIDNNEGYNEICVLFRSVFQAMELEMELNKRNIQYIMRGGIRFFDQKHIKDISGFLKILSNLHDEIAWRRVLMLYEGVGAKTAEKIINQVKTHKTIDSFVESFNFSGSDKVVNSTKSIKNIFKKIRVNKDSSIKNSIDIILKNGYIEYLKTNFDNYIDRIEDINQLSEFSKNHKKLKDFLSDITLSENFKSNNKTITSNNSSNRIVLSTIHQAKGLEWDNVFVIGLTDGQFPHKKVYDKPLEIEEERRLFYVAVTRARNNLYLTFPATNNQNNTINRASIFIEELKEDLFDKKENNIGFDDLPIIEYD